MRTTIASLYSTALRPVLRVVVSVYASLSVLGCGDSSTGEGPHLKVKLVADQTSVSPGSTFTLGVQFTPDPGWHIYWKNPGDSGLPPRFTWTHQGGVAIQQPLWPFPERIPVGPLVNYGYGDVLIPFPAHIGTESTISSVRTSLELQWLVCKEECLPGEATLSLTLPVTKSPGTPSPHAAAFERALQHVPPLLDRVSIAVEEQEDQIILALIPLAPRYLPSSATFFPEDPRIIANAAPQVSTRDGDVFRISLKRHPSQRETIERIRGVLVSPTGWSESGAPQAVQIDTSPGEVIPENTPRTVTTSPEPSSLTRLPSILLLAFMGGILLNLMPCVFPVLSIKIVSFLQHANEDRTKTRRHGIAFSLGVLLSFWIVATMLLILRAGGEQLGWGFQLQSPTFVVVMIFVFLVVGLMMMSDVVIGHTIQRVTGRWNLPTSYLGSFLSGVLATAVATPCTGPFMSTALAATLTLPAAASLLIFTSLGAGMCLPYLLLSFQPSLLRFLPRPGAWMESFKQLMAFPLFASVVWLTRVFARQMGMEPPGLTVLMDVLWGALLATFGFWLLTRTRATDPARTRATLTCGAVAACIAGIWIAIPTEREIDESRARACAPSDAVIPFTDSFGLLWESYSEDRLRSILAQGRRVYIDFTAEWCITCQVNERVVFGSQEVRNLLAQKNITLMRADWTSKNPTITAALRSYGRNGVPLNVIVTDASASPIILPNLLTPGIVIEELQRLQD